MRFHRQPLIAFVLALISSYSALRAADFRVDSRIFVGKESTPHSSNVTLFQGPHAYDFLDKPRQITFYDLQRGRTVLVDPQRRIKAEVSQAMLSAFCDSLRHLEKQTQDPLLQFSLRPVFDEHDAKDGSQRVFASKHLTYRVKPIAADLDGMAGRYRQFSDASAQLNAFINRGSLPPFPRLAVNASLDKSGHLPANVQLTVSRGQSLSGSSVSLRSEHDFRSRLLDSDLARIEEAGALLSECTPVSIGDYLKPRAE